MTIMAHTAISKAFAIDHDALVATDALAGRLAAGKLGKDDTPAAISATFQAAGFADASAADAESTSCSAV